MATADWIACKGRATAAFPGLQILAKTFAISLQRAMGYADSAEVAKPCEADAECPQAKCVARQAVPGQTRFKAAKAACCEEKANAVHLSLRDPYAQF